MWFSLRGMGLKEEAIRRHYAETMVQAMQLIQLRDIRKTYAVGEVEVRRCKASRWTSIAANTSR